MDVLNEKEVVNQIASQIIHLEKVKTREESDLKEAEVKLKCSQDAQEILQFLAQAVQQQAHAKISDVVSRCLSAVFDDPYEFHILFDRKRGKTEANLRFIRRGMNVDPLTASGGGVIDVAAFALRVACLLLSRPRLSKVIVLDEPFRFVSIQYQENVRSMLEQLSVEMNMQIIMVSHIENLATGEVIELE